MKHEMGLQPKYFEFMARGTKRIELRLYDEKRAKIRIRDEIEFKNAESGEKILMKVVGLLRYASFEDLLRDFDISQLADESMTKEELLSDLKKFYTVEKQREFGVIGIMVEEA